MSQVLEIFTDGACRGNPGPGGWGAVLRYGKHEKHLYGAEAFTTNNRMELTAVIEGLKAVKRAVNIVVTTDSKYVQMGMTQWIHNWKKRAWKSGSKGEVKNKDLWQELDALCEGKSIQWHWVKGHSGHPENELADTLANKGIDSLAV